MDAKPKEIHSQDEAEEVVAHPSVSSNVIPGPPSTSPDPRTVDIIKYYKQARIDHDFKLIESIRRNKEFGNPYILTKVVDHFKIDQLGSNYPKEIFDPEELNPTEFEESFKRRRTTNTQPVVTAQAVPVTAGPQPTQVPVAPYTANVLAAAIASINASVATAKKEPSREGEEKRKTKWG